ncbi:hypothetical protein [Streptomyces coelicoflavus]|uniref:Uncharacterized protein n=1 Tax=Streptomyces coelicoflavus TaxID=285562 RepID=A0A6N9UWN2_9ACTN|nr:hypothetical protein [Streptomyces coelicoflavus]NEB22127.1 hypothetical protein [Streptomyces coelicoflavus]
MGRQKPGKPRRSRNWSKQVEDALSQRCPDCLSSVTLRRISDGVNMIKLEHNSTCPNWGAKAAAAGIDRHQHDILHGVFETPEVI